VSLDDEAADRAVQRLAETLTLGTRLVNMPLYRLLAVDIHKGAIAGSFGITHFVRYALTMDLLEGELIDALAAGVSDQPGALQLRDTYLPDLASVLGVAGRLCAGGALALCAVARPASRPRSAADYLLLVQERSGDVVNAARRLAVIPKGFHQPMADYRADAQIGSTLRREPEEELFGREDIDNTIGQGRRADPMHPSRLSEPMRWLDADPRPNDRRMHRVRPEPRQRKLRVRRSRPHRERGVLVPLRRTGRGQLGDLQCRVFNRSSLVGVISG